MWVGAGLSEGHSTAARLVGDAVASAALQQVALELCMLVQYKRMSCTVSVQGVQAMILMREGGYKPSEGFVSCQLR